MSDEAILYYCDPNRNTKCRKAGCLYVLRPCEGGACDATFNRAFARLDGKGKPIVYKKQHESTRKERTEGKNVSGTDQ